jgi:hypothetical protein
MTLPGPFGRHGPIKGADLVRVESIDATLARRLGRWKRNRVRLRVRLAERSAVYQPRDVWKSLPHAPSRSAPPGRPRAKRSGVPSGC